jgi:membrane peptidoglycan carboxypeptidase
LPQAVLASEDTSYYWHIGVDPFSVARAIVMNVRAGRLREGGSTITQQLARNLLGSTYVGREDSAGRKWREAAAAIKLNFTYSKDEILTFYLNRVYLGNGVYGFQDAARLYFGKAPQELDLSEAATLVGILPEPETANPFRNKNRALEYRDRVLNRMAELGMVSREESERARRSILRLKEENKTELQGTIAPYFYSYVFEELEEQLGDRFALEGNLIVETGFDPRLQRASDRAVQAAIAEDGAAGGFSQGAIVTLRHGTGEIVAMTGGRDYRTSQFNRATQAKRQPGSTFKLFAYAAAVNQGISPFTTFPCTDYLGVAGCRRGGSSMDMVDGFAFSENVVALRVAEAAGLGNVIRTARALGVTSELAENRNLALGGFEVSMLEMVAAYGAIANEGRYIKPHAIRRIRDSGDCQDRNRRETCRVIFDAQQDLTPRRALSGDIAATLREMMRAVVATGTGVNAQIPQEIVLGKTGTTDNSRDLWFVGSVRGVTAAVWLGNDEGVTNGSSAIAAEVFQRFLGRALDAT